MQLNREVNLDLKNKKYDLKTLKENIHTLDYNELLETQKLTPNFIAKYVINKKKGKNIFVDYIIKVQPHITRFEMVNALVDYDSDKDSFEEY